MLGNRELALDRFCEVYDLLKPWMDFEFYELRNHNPAPGAVYLIGRRQFTDNVDLIKNLATTSVVVLSNPHEGSETLHSQCVRLGYDSLIKQGKILLIGGGDMDPGYTYLCYDSFLPKILDYSENIEAIKNTEQIYQQKNKPYKFLFLNGRIRAHRKYLLEKFRLNGLLDHALWTNLDSNPGSGSVLQLPDNLMQTPTVIKTLPVEYEFTRYRDRVNNFDENHYKKYNLFNNEWGEIYLEPKAYIDTYFSLITETVFDYPWSFRTEKIWKPVAMGHPFIAVANAGYYRDLRNLGFQTFDTVIDESFDNIQDNQQRIERIATIVEDLCRQDLAKFLEECYTVCKYNQQHLAEISKCVRKEFPQRFRQFIQPYINE
jgi:hypothetical protein